MEKQPPLISLRYPFLELVLVLSILLFSMFVFTFLGIYISSALFHISITDLMDTDNPGNISALKLVQVFSEIGFIAPALVFAGLMGQRNDYLKLSRATYMIPAILVAGVMLLSQPMVNYLGVLNSHLQLPAALSKIQQWMQKTQDQDDALTALFLRMPNFKELIINIVIMAVIPAICEEALFRGTLQQILIKWFGNKHAAVWVTGALFSAVHMEFFGFVPRMILGVMLGYIFLWSGNLWYSIIGHMINNGLAVIAFYLYQSKSISYDPNSNDIGPAWLIIISTILFVGLLVVYNRYFKHHPPGEEDLVKEEEI